MKYILENANEATRLENQSRSSLYNPISELEGFEITPGLSVLDAGCGSGLVARIIAERYPGVHVFGVDASEARIVEAKKFAVNSPGIEFRVAQLTDPLSHKFDRIICRFVVEHLSDDAQMAVVKNLADSLACDGQIRLIDIDGGILNIFPKPPLLEEILEILESKRAIDFFAGRKLPKLLVDSGLHSVTWRVQTMMMNSLDLLEEEAKLMAERFENMLSAIAKLIGSHEKAENFKKEYLNILRRPGTTLFYNKFIASGYKSSALSFGRLKAV